MKPGESHEDVQNQTVSTVSPYSYDKGQFERIIGSKDDQQKKQSRTLFEGGRR